MIAGSVALLRPWWLLALPVVVGVYVMSRPRGGSLAAWETASDPHLLAAMVARGATGAGTRLRTPAVLATLVLGILALAGPAIRRHDANRLRNLDATMLVVDVSQAMADGGHIREAAVAADDVLDHLGARQAGLVVFAGDAYAASALTDFPGAIATDLFALDDTTVPDPGVRPDRGLVLAGKMLDEAHIISGDIVLVTSGDGLDGTAAIRAAAVLAGAGRRVYAMAAGDPGAATKAMAAAGGGFAVDMLHPERLLATLSGRAIERTGSSAINALTWRDLGRFILLIAALPLLLGFRKVGRAPEKTARA